MHLYSIIPLVSLFSLKDKGEKEESLISREVEQRLNKYKCVSSSSTSQL